MSKSCIQSTQAITVRQKDVCIRRTKGETPVGNRRMLACGNPAFLAARLVCTA